MQIVNCLDEWRAIRHSIPSHLSVGFVPTMGNLHMGHASLFKKSRDENDCTIASIFVNPSQFNQSDDFKNYPRTLSSDIELLTDLNVDYCLIPTADDIYKDHYHYQIHEINHSQFMEGQQRPGHFNGVLAVVMKLLNLVKPHSAYFGEKDYQQFQLIRDMVSSFFMDIEIKPCPTIRAPSGLAYSSRNNRLTKEQRLRADQFARVFHQAALPIDELTAELNKIDVALLYLQEHDGRRFIAINIDGIRLIDNYKI